MQKLLLSLRIILIISAGSAGIFAGLLENISSAVAWLLVLILLDSLETAESRIKLYKDHNEFLWNEIQRIAKQRSK